MPTIHLHLHRRAARDAGESVEERRRALTGGAQRPEGPSVEERRAALKAGTWGGGRAGYSSIPRYNAEAVQKGINRDPRIGKKEGVLIHRLLKGRHDAKRRDAVAGWVPSEVVKCWDCGERFPPGTTVYPTHQTASGKKCPMSGKKVPVFSGDAKGRDAVFQREGCPRCGGSGNLASGQTCPRCKGTGEVKVNVAGPTPLEKAARVARGMAKDDFDPSVAKRRGESYAKLHSQWNRAMNARTASKSSAERASLMTQISALEHAMGAESAALQRGKTGDSFLITVKNPSPKPMYPTSQYRVHAATEAEARKKWDLHHNQTPILKIVQDRKRKTGDRARFKTRDCPDCGGTCGGHDAGGRQVTTSNAKGEKFKVYLPSKEEEQARARAHTERQKPSAAVRAALRQPVDGQRKFGDAVTGLTTKELRDEIRAVRQLIVGSAGIVLKRENPRRYAELEKRLTELLDAAMYRDRSAKDAPQHGREATGKVQAGWPESVRYKGKQWFRSDGRGVGRIMRTGAPSKTYVFWQEGMREDDEVAVDRDGNLYDDFA